MLFQYAFAWIHLWGRLRDCEDELNRHMHSFAARGLLGDPGSVPLPASLQDEIMGMLEEMFPQAQCLGLDVSLDTMRRLVSLTHSAVQGYEPPTAKEIHRRLVELRERIEAELRGRRFLFVPGQKAALYDQEELFGRVVAQNFGKASFHIREAGTCLALSRPTAAVFHLMCVLEVGLDSLADSVGLPYSEKNWGVILDEIEKKALPDPVWVSHAPPSGGTDAESGPGPWGGARKSLAPGRGRACPARLRAHLRSLRRPRAGPSYPPHPRAARSLPPASRVWVSDPHESLKSPESNRRDRSAAWRAWRR